MQGYCVCRSQSSINPTQCRASNSRDQRLDCIVSEFRQSFHYPCHAKILPFKWDLRGCLAPSFTLLWLPSPVFWAYGHMSPTRFTSSTGIKPGLPLCMLSRQPPSWTACPTSSLLCGRNITQTFQNVQHFQQFILLWTSGLCIHNQGFHLEYLCRSPPAKKQGSLLPVTSSAPSCSPGMLCHILSCTHFNTEKVFFFFYHEIVIN